MATTELIGLLTRVDGAGNKQLMYPVTKVEAVDGLEEYVGSAVTEANAYTDSKHITKTATLSTNWAGAAAPYSQTIPVNGILASDFPHIAPVYSGDFATAVAEREAWNMINASASEDGTITFVCFDDKPTTAITVLIEVMR